MKKESYLWFEILKFNIVDQYILYVSNCLFFVIYFNYKISCQSFILTQKRYDRLLNATINGNNFFYDNYDDYKIGHKMSIDNTKYTSHTFNIKSKMPDQINYIDFLQQ